MPWSQLAQAALATANARVALANNQLFRAQSLKRNDFATQDRQVIEYPGAHHTLEFEPDPRPVFADLTQWLRDRL